MDHQCLFTLPGPGCSCINRQGSTQSERGAKDLANERASRKSFAEAALGPKEYSLNREHLKFS